MSPVVTESTAAHLDLLVEDIWKRPCFALVGAGFSKPAALPGWKNLPSKILEAAKAVETTPWLDGLSIPAEVEEPALELSVLNDNLGPKKFGIALGEALKKDEIPDPYLKQRRHLLGIPFRAILTMNYDTLLESKRSPETLLDPSLPGPETYNRLLRTPPVSPWDARFWAASDKDPVGAEIVKIHGCVSKNSQLTVTEQDYQRRLFSDPGYLTFIRSLCAHWTPVLIGTSNSDKYLNLLQGELSYLFSRGSDAELGLEASPPLGYWILGDPSPQVVRNFRKSFGIAIIGYPLEGKSHEKLGELLHEIRVRSNPVERLRSQFKGFRIVWCDDNPRENNELGLALLNDLICYIDEFAPAGRLRSELSKGDVALVITRWGGREGEYARDVMAVLRELQASGEAAPALVFSKRSENRLKALKMGFTDLVTEWVELLQAVERLGPRPSDA